MKLNITALTVKSLATALVALTLTVAASGQPRAGKTEDRISAKKVESISNCLLIDAVQKFEDGDFATAKTILSAIISKDPGNDAAWYYRAMCNVRLKDGASSEHDFKEAVRIDSTNYWYRYMLAGLYGMTGRKDLTISMYESLLKDFPKRSELYYGLANLYLDQHQDDKALATIDDIETYNTKITIEELKANVIPSTLADVTAAVVNGNYALDFGLKTEDAIYKDDQLDIEEYWNLIAARSADLEDADKLETYKKVVAAFQSDETEKVFNDQFGGYFIKAGWDQDLLADK